MFQSHTGSIQRTVDEVGDAELEQVSIPHWFDSTPALAVKMEPVAEVSIPHWFDSTTISPPSGAGGHPSFNPTLVRFNGRRLRVSRGRAWWFQSHTGSIQR